MALIENLPLTIEENDERILKNYKPIFYKRLANAGKITKQSLENEVGCKKASQDTVTMKSTKPRGLENFPVWFLNTIIPLSKDCAVGLYACREGVLHFVSDCVTPKEWRAMIQEGYLSLHDAKFCIEEQLAKWKQQIVKENGGRSKIFVILVIINNIILRTDSLFEFGQNNELETTTRSIIQLPVTPSSPKKRAKTESPTVLLNEFQMFQVEANTIRQGEALQITLSHGFLPEFKLSWVMDNGYYHCLDVEVDKSQQTTCSIKCIFQQGPNQITLFGQTELFWVKPPKSETSSHSDLGGADSRDDTNSPHGSDGQSDPNNNNSPNQGQMYDSDVNTPNGSPSENNDGNGLSENLDTDSMPEEETRVTITEVLPSSIPIGVSQLAAILGDFEGISENTELEILFGGRRGRITSRSSYRIFAKTPTFTNPIHVEVTLKDVRKGTILATKQQALLVVLPPQHVSLTAQLAQKDKEIAEKNIELAQKNTELARKDEQIQQLSSQVPAANVQLEYNVQQENENSTQGTKANEQNQPVSIAHLHKSLHSFGESRFIDFIQQESQLEQICNPLNKANWRLFGEQLGFKRNQLDDIEKRHKASPARQLLKEWETKSDSTMKNYITALVNSEHSTALNKMSELFPKYIADIEEIAEVQRREKRINDLTQLTDNLQLQIHSLSQDRTEVENKLRGEKVTLERQLDTLQAELASTSSRRDRDHTKIPNPWILMACIIAVIGIGIVFYVPTPSGPLSPPSPSYPQSSAFSPTPLSSPYPMSSLNPPSSPNPTTAWQTIQPTVASDYYHSTSVTITYVSNEYLHVTGNTYRIKEMLKQHGARWLPNDKAWKIPNVPRKAEELSQIIKTMYPTEHVVIVDGRGKTNADIPGQR